MSSQSPDESEHGNTVAETLACNSALQEKPGDMEILHSCEAFKTIDGKLQFAYISVIIRQDNHLYTAKWNERRSLPKNMSQLSDVRQFETEDRGPKMRPDWTISSVTDCYIKTPSLLAYTLETLEDHIFYDVEASEILRKNPHPNVALYYGCQETRGRVSALCFKRYTSTLHERVNPEHLGKPAFRSSDRSLVDDNVKASLDGIFRAIQHLHSLSLVHNDINPANIMFTEDNTPILIDFDSCRKVGVSLVDTNAGRTHEWFDPEVKVSLKENDLNAFAELKTWLIGSETDEFLFK